MQPTQNNQTPQNIDATLKKIGMVLEKMVQKINEIDARVTKLEQKALPEAKSLPKVEAHPSPANVSKTPTISQQSSGGFGHSFLGSLAGAMAGMGLYNLLFDHNVSASDFGHQLGIDSDDAMLQENLENIDEKLQELDEKIDTLDDKLDTVAQDTEDFDSLQDFDNFDSANDESDFDFDDFGGGFDDI